MPYICQDPCSTVQVPNPKEPVKGEEKRDVVEFKGPVDSVYLKAKDYVELDVGTGAAVAISSSGWEDVVVVSPLHRALPSKHCDENMSGWCLGFQNVACEMHVASLCLWHHMLMLREHLQLPRLAVCNLLLKWRSAYSGRARLPKCFL